MRHPGIEPGPSAWKADILTSRPMTLVLLFFSASKRLPGIVRVSRRMSNLFPWFCAASPCELPIDCGVLTVAFTYAVAIDEPPNRYVLAARFIGDSCGSLQAADPL